ncbi:hypothetical protein RFI_20724 [Reticulomyxa filosa]|uniref:Uncharacterized protein n=1 Tax=Reticulomyxa filosa TaxID=46433 RepID=X6MRH3_RETFI|nr:hypothetical protein RFI_20724 [Reticulomyxa filosa]|eukprot:ETO16618.1 hypothetical protein RFI_20724 [Reticulomyxa filosa]
MRALDEAEMVDKGIKYWEEQTVTRVHKAAKKNKKKNKAKQMDIINHMQMTTTKEFQHPSVEWWQLKSAKDFETGVGQKLFRGGTLSRWTDAEVKALQDEMEKTLASVGKSAHVKVATTATAPMVQSGNISSIPEDAVEVVEGTLFIISIHFISPFFPLNKYVQQETQGPLRLESMLDLDAYIAKKAQAEAEEEEAQAKAQAQAQKTNKKEFQDLIAEQQKTQGQTKKENDKDKQKQEEDGQEDEKQDAQSKRNKHQRTRTEALRIKLEDMSKKLEQVHSDLDEEKEEHQRKLDEIQMLETEAARNRRRVGNNEKLKQEMLQLQGALSSAQNELLAAEQQLQEKDQEILNLRRELQITKELNNTLSVTALSGTTLTPDDLLNQRIADANRFAIMVAAMQEQLEFERNQFVFRIHQLELQLEHKDVQINSFDFCCIYFCYICHRDGLKKRKRKIIVIIITFTALYELYNKLVESTQPKKGWFQRFRESVSQSSS